MATTRKIDKPVKKVIRDELTFLVSGKPRVKGRKRSINM